MHEQLTAIRKHICRLSDAKFAELLSDCELIIADKELDESSIVFKIKDKIIPSACFGFVDASAETLFPIVLPLMVYREYYLRTKDKSK